MAVITRNTLSDVQGSRSLDLGVAAANGTAVASSDTITNYDGKTIFVVYNGGGSSDTVTITAQTTAQRTAGNASVTAASETGAVAASGGIRVFGPFPPAIFNDTSGFITVSHSFTTSVKIYAFNLASY